LSRIDVATLAVRVIGIYCLFQSLGVFYALAMLLLSGDRLPRNVAVYVAPYFAPLAAGLLFLIKAEPIARRMLPKGGTYAEAPAVRPGRELQSLTFAVVGIWLWVEAFRYLALGLARLAVRNEGGDLPVWAAVQRDFVPAIALIAGGCWLFFGGKRISAFWHRIRHPELHQPGEP
jgi:hypothetical protein